MILEEKLLPYQLEPAHALRGLVTTRRQSADMSDTGLGKTYIALAVAQSLRQPVLVVSPLSVKPSWHRVAAHFGIQVDVETYNLLRNGKTKWFSKHEGPPPGTRYKQKAHFRYTGPHDSLVIFDEGHNCAGRGTQNAELLIACKRQNVRTLVLSATLAESPLQMRATGYTLGLHSLSDYWDWARKQHVVITPTMGPQWYAGKEMKLEIMSKIQSILIPQRAIRLRMSELAHLFPENIVTAEVYEMETAKINRAYEEMREEVEKVAADRILDRQRDDARRDKFEEDLAEWEETERLCQLRGEDHVDPKPEWRTALPAVQSSRHRQEIELLKVPTFLQLAADAVAEGNRVALFVNFSATIDAILRQADGVSVVRGGQDEGLRQDMIDDFNSGTAQMIVLNSAAGGAGISLHDTVGDSPRVALVSPTFSAKVLKQVLGRCPRAGGRSPVVQKILFAAGTPEEEACKAVRGKLGCLAALNDGDLAAGLPFDLDDDSSSDS